MDHPEQELYWEVEIDGQVVGVWCTEDFLEALMKHPVIEGRSNEI